MSFIVSAILNKLIKSAENLIIKQFSNYFGKTIHNLFDNGDNNNKIQEIFTQKNSVGNTIPIVYGEVLIAGNVIWYEVKNNKLNIIIIICRGEIDDIEYVMVDDIISNEFIEDNTTKTLVNKNTSGTIKYRLYRGTYTQPVDPLGQGVAYRGRAYMAIENIPIVNNKIPNFKFLVKRFLSSETLQVIKGINIIPGNGEFAYDTIAQYKYNLSDNPDGTIKNKRSVININSDKNIPDAIISTNELQRSFKHLEWIAVTVIWYIDSLDIASCNIYPAVEYQGQTETTPNSWKVANFNRNSARLITYEDGHPIYGGTINDESLMRYLDYLKTKGYKIMLVPLLMVDSISKTWRGEVTGNSSGLDNFISKYYLFIEHYAILTKDKIDGFVIGTELKGITKITDNNIDFPGVDRLLGLSTQIKQILPTKIITYAANWDEYHSSNGVFNMDKLWASDSIDVVGINAYFPLTDRPQPAEGFTQEELINSWISGEGYDYYYDDHGNRQQFTDPKFAWKNIEYWWSNEHDSRKIWHPKMKEIWFTEYGFSSIDNCTSDPHIFVNSHSTVLPRYSKGIEDKNAQYNAIKATLTKWGNSQMVTNMFIWSWDIRPYPYFPQKSDVWKDAASWFKGHWINGKANLNNLSDILEDIMKNAPEIESDASKIEQKIDGLIIPNNTTIKEMLNILQTIYQFNTVNYDKMFFIPKSFSNNKTTIEMDQIVHYKVNKKYTEAANINLSYINKDNNYSVEQISIDHHQSSNTYNISSYLVSNPKEITKIAKNIYKNKITESTVYNIEVIVTSEIFSLRVGDTFTLLLDDDMDHLVKITNVIYKYHTMIIDGVKYINNC